LNERWKFSAVRGVSLQVLSNALTGEVNYYLKFTNQLTRLHSMARLSSERTIPS
jgi:hypothetical protein